jgi:hypothetical protein
MYCPRTRMNSLNANGDARTFIPSRHFIGGLDRHFEILRWPEDDVCADANQQWQ